MEEEQQGPLEGASVRVGGMTMGPPTPPELSDGARVDTMRYTSVRMLWKAVSTLVESKADVSMKLKLFFSANAFASSVGTARRWRRSDLFPTWTKRTCEVVTLQSNHCDKITLCYVISSYFVT